MENLVLTKQFDPLEDGISLVEYVDHMGNDASITRSARVSYSKDKTPFDVEKDSKLIRHRVGVSFNEVSLRYTEAKDEFYIPKQLYSQDRKNRQGSAEPLSDAANEACIEQIKQNSITTMANYRFSIASGCSKEHARMILPVNLYTR